MIVESKSRGMHRAEIGIVFGLLKGHFAVIIIISWNRKKQINTHDALCFCFSFVYTISPWATCPPRSRARGPSRAASPCCRGTGSLVSPWRCGPPRGWFCGSRKWGRGEATRGWTKCRWSGASRTLRGSSQSSSTRTAWPPRRGSAGRKAWFPSAALLAPSVYKSLVIVCLISRLICNNDNLAWDLPNMLVFFISIYVKPSGPIIFLYSINCLSSFLKIFAWYLLLNVSLRRSDEISLFNIWIFTVSLVVILPMVVGVGVILKVFMFFKYDIYKYYR